MTTSDRPPFDPDAEIPLPADDLARLASQIYAQLSGVQVGTPSVPVDSPPQVVAGSPSSVPVSAPTGLPVSIPAGLHVSPPTDSPAGLHAAPVPHAASVPHAFPTLQAPSVAGFSDWSAGHVPADIATSSAYPLGDVEAPEGSGLGGPGGGWPGGAQSAAIAAAVVGTYPSLPQLQQFVGFATPDLSGYGRRAEPDYFELGDPARSGGVRHQVLDDGAVFDVDTLRRDFPILQERVGGHQLVWLDNAATTHKPNAVIDRISHFYRHENSNIHRAAHELAARATNAYEEARETVRRYIGAAKTEEIVFVRGTTEAINLVAFAWGDRFIGEGDEIVITNLEHHANTVPWQQLAQRKGAILKVAPVDDRGTLLLGELEKLLGPRTKLVAATQVSNALGTITPVKEIVALGHRYGARVLIDGAQSVPHTAVDVQDIGADFFVFSGHKIFGPTGIGVLYGREDALAETPPWQSGGNMIADVTYERSIFQGPPNKFEAGTGNIADAVGLGEALRYVERVGIHRIAQFEHRLLEYTTPQLASIPGLRIIGTSPEKASVISFVLKGQDTIRVGQRLNDVGIAVRAGHHCAQPILRRLGVETTVRPSFAFYNTFDEADRLIDAVRWIAANPDG